MSDPKLTDQSLMPFGKHRGKMMCTVPCDYLVWLYNQDWITSWPDVKDYIEENWDVIEFEAENKRW